MKNPSDPMENRSRGLPAFSATAYTSDIMGDGQIPKKERGCCMVGLCVAFP